MLNKLPAFVSLLILLSSSLYADFSSSNLELHPQLPGTEPFILEISGTWPTDCHPGEQKPVVKSFDGHRVEIEFEIIVVHITCNNYRYRLPGIGGYERGGSQNQAGR